MKHDPGPWGVDAAPDLLEALEAIMAPLDHLTDDDLLAHGDSGAQQRVLAARAAIAKAKTLQAANG